MVLMVDRRIVKLLTVIFGILILSIAPLQADYCWNTCGGPNLDCTTIDWEMNINGDGGSR